MDDTQISAARLRIVDTMHANGLSLNYPPPASLLKERRRMAVVERLQWLERLRAKYTSVEDAAKGEGCTRNTINHHCKKLHGASFTEWIRKSIKQ